MQVSKPTISRDIEYLRQQARTNIRRYIDETLPEECEKCLIGLTAILREAWNTAQDTEDRREKMQALSLAKESYSMKLELLTNAIVVDDAMKFVEQSKEKLRLSSYATSSTKDNEEPRESDYHKDSNNLGEEEQTGEITTTTTNEVF